MNKIAKHPLKRLGYGFIDPQFLPEGKDEYYLRKTQQRRQYECRHHHRQPDANAQSQQNDQDGQGSEDHSQCVHIDDQRPSAASELPRR